jgi:predicted Zn-dependent protease
MNAFALPGGTVVVLDGLVRRTGGDDRLTAVVGHELAHLSRHHSAEALVRGAGLTGLAGLLWGDFSSAAANLPAALAVLGYSRDAEREADDDAVRFLRAAGRPPGALVELLCLFSEEGRSDGLIQLPDLFSSHPSLEERLAHARQAAGVEGACPVGQEAGDELQAPGSEGEVDEGGDQLGAPPDGDGQDGNVQDGEEGGEDEDDDPPPRDTTI